MNYHCICRETIDVLFTEFPPYIYTEPGTKKIVGLIPGILQEAIHSCCVNCSKINYNLKYKTINELLSQVRAATILTPIVSLIGSKSFLNSTYIELFETRGVAYVTTKERNLEYFQKFLDSILSNWPLFLISILLALNAGILIWLLDSWSNKDEFPMSFHKGVIEGLWWAYVTMTTVGYGDKTPKSLPARFLSMMWIFIGIAISGIFTASLITGMTQSLSPEKVSLDDKTIGVTNHTSYEYQIVFMDYKDMKAALQNKSVEGLLMDVFALSYFYDDLRGSIDNLHIRTDAIKNTKTSYGIVFPYDAQNATNKLWATHLAEFFWLNQDNMDTLLQISKSKLKQHLHPVMNVEMAGQLSIFNSPTIYKLLFKYIGVSTLTLLTIGFFFEKLRLAGKMYVASRQDKWANKVEAKATAKEACETKREKVEMTRLTAVVDVSTISLRQRFEVAMKEIEIEEGNADYSNVTKKLLERVFSDDVLTEAENDVIHSSAA
eukprot:gene19104-21019_t